MSMVAAMSLAAWVVVPMLWGWDAYTVVTGSMAPTVQPGDVIVASRVDTTALPPGTVVVIAPAGAGLPPVTHRVVERLPDGRYRTRGDANPAPDARLVTPEEITGTVRIVVPLAGQTRLQLGRGGPPYAVAVVLGGLLMAFRLRRRPEPFGPGHAFPGRSSAFPGRPSTPTGRPSRLIGPAVVLCVVTVSAIIVHSSWATTHVARTTTIGTPAR